MKNIIILSMLVVLAGCTAPVNQKMHSDYEDQTILTGMVNWDGFTGEPYNEWFTPNYLNYAVDSVTLATLGDLADIKITTFMGTWCQDSQAEVPQFYKILDYLTYDLSGMTVYAIDRGENGLIVPQEYATYKIEHVPTFIFYRDGKEIGRITEYPVKTIEKDMLDIIGN